MRGRIFFVNSRAWLKKTNNVFIKRKVSLKGGVDVFRTSRKKIANAA